LQLGSKQALPKGLTQLGLGTSYSHFGEAYRGTTRTDTDGLSLDILITTLSARHHFEDGWSADLSLPTGSIWLQPGGGEHTRTLSGFGDLELGGAYDFAALWGAGGYRPSLRLRAGIGLPTGKESTLTSADSEAPPSVLSIGLASYSAVTELTFTQFLSSRVAIMAPISTRVPLGKTESGKDFGNVFRYGGSLVVIPGKGLVVSAGVEHQVRGYVTEQEEGRLLNSGSTVTRAVFNTSYRASDLLSLQLGAGRPIRVDAQGSQISESFSFSAGLGLSFGGKDEDDHDHGGDHDDHDHGSDHDDHDDHGQGDRAAGRGDVAELATGGASFELSRAIVPGKITVIDFWAAWCKPCKAIDATLVALAKRHDNLAVRRVEIVDVDSPATRQHLGGKVALPEVWILDQRGRRLHALRATSAAQVERSLERLLRR
jgi:thiol-disulfide isomerase/thioredoxin